MKKMVRKFLALTMVGVLMATPLTAFATETTESPATGDTTGTGAIEGIVDKEVFSIVLPTVAENDTTFNFIMDPQGLIAATEGAKYESKTFEEGASLLFNNVAEDKTTDYSSKSDVLTTINKSSVAVDVAIDATITGLDGIDLVTADADGKYVYALTEEAKDESYEGFDSVAFNLTGTCITNEDVDWEATKDITPAVNVTWTLKKHVDGPSVATTATFVKGTELSLPVTLGETSATKATVKLSTSATSGFATSTGISYNATTQSVVMAANACSAATAGSKRYLQVTFDDPDATVIVIEVTIATAAAGE